jgi:hypothetical protein
MQSNITYAVYDDNARIAYFLAAFPLPVWRLRERARDVSGEAEDPYCCVRRQPLPGTWAYLVRSESEDARSGVQKPVDLTG